MNEDDEIEAQVEFVEALFAVIAEKFPGIKIGSTSLRYSDELRFPFELQMTYAEREEAAE